MLSRVEGMPANSLAAGVPWDWQTFGEYLGKLDGKLGVNAGFMAGHSAIRRVVMGKRAVGEKATPAELEQMKACSPNRLRKARWASPRPYRRLTRCRRQSGAVPARKPRRTGRTCARLPRLRRHVARIPAGGRSLFAGDQTADVGSFDRSAAPAQLERIECRRSGNDGKPVGRRRTSRAARRRCPRVDDSQPITLRINLFAGFGIPMR
jgi:hypothetical protein